MGPCGLIGYIKGFRVCGLGIRALIRVQGFGLGCSVVVGVQGISDGKPCRI